MAGSDRVLDFEGIHNFRDHGGYAVSDGGRLRRGVLWRSGQHHDATDADLARIGELGLASVFDLRTSVERTTHPCRRPLDFRARIHEANDPETMSAPHLAAAATARQRSAQSTRDGFVRNYQRLCFRPELQDMIRRYLAELAEGKGPSLVNCMAGKDRTGITVAMLHSAVGVHRDDIIEDYLLTNTAGNPDARIAAGGRTIRHITGQVDEDVLRVMMGVEAEYLEAAFSAVEDVHGSIDAYLETQLGADAALRERLRGALVEG